MAFIRNKHRFSPEIRAQIAQLREMDNWHGFVALSYDYLVIISSFLLFWLSPWFYPISLILIGSRQRALATILHEAAHKALVKSRKLNYFIGTWLSGYLIFQEYNVYTDSHVKRHHGYLGDREKDPDYAFHIEQGLYQSCSPYQFMTRFILKPLALFKTISYLGYLIRHRFLPNKKFRKQFFMMMAYWSLIAVTCYHFGLLAELVLLWFIPLITTAAIFGWFNELAEHYPYMSQATTDIHMSRNRFSHWLEHFLCNTHNEHFHLIHHLYPTIPFWNLPKAHRVLMKDTEYAALNAKMGGIFVSANQNPSLIEYLVNQHQEPAFVQQNAYK